MANIKITIDEIEYEFRVEWIDGLQTYIGKPVKELTTPIFYTEKNEPVYYMEEYWVVDQLFTLESFHAKTSLSGLNSNNKYFLTELDATDYILINKPCLSVQDFINLWKNKNIESSPLIYDIKKLAKTKIKL